MIARLCWITTSRNVYLYCWYLFIAKLRIIYKFVCQNYGGVIQYAVLSFFVRFSVLETYTGHAGYFLLSFGVFLYWAFLYS